MKHVKINSQTLLITLFFLFLGMASATAQEKNPETVIIRAFELTKGKSSHMTVTSPEGLTKSIGLENVDLGTFEGDSGNSIIIQSEINQWKKEGFEIDEMSTQMTYLGGIVTTIILSKD